MSVQDLGISIVAKTPIWSGNQRTVDANLVRKANAYEHELLANGGYWACSFDFAANKSDIEDWLQNGVGREITVRNEAQTIIWNGVVNVVNINMGALTLVRGPLLDITNQLQVIYQTVTYNTNPPVGGQRQQGGLASNAASQALYGTLHTTLSGGVGNSEEMDQFRDVYIAERAWPATSINFNLGNSGQPSIKLECVGFAQLLDKQPYVQIINSGTENASTKMQNILTANADGLYTDFTRIQANTLQVPQYENDQNTAWSLIKDTVARGDTSDNRWIFRIEDERVPRYAPAPTTVEYTYRSADQEPRLLDLGGSRVLPWNIRPGKWVMVTDLLIGGDLITPLAQDLRTTFIESVRYSSVWGLQLNGSKETRLQQQMNKLGLGGTF